MNSVLLGVDFIIKDEEILLLEMNTDINLSYSKSPYFDFTQLFEYLINNEFTTLRVIYKTQLVSNVVIDTMREFCTTNNITFDEILIPANSVTIPSYNDDAVTLNLRFAYNAQAILDDSYCRDKSELVNLLFEGGSETIIPKTYINYNGTVLDTLDTPIDNGIIPNLIAKKQLPDFTKSRYPEFIKASTSEELTQVKSDLEAGVFLQEYQFSSANVEQGVITNHIRQWFLITNQLSEIISCGGYLQSNQINLDESIIQYTDLKLNNMSRYMFFSNPTRTLDEGVPSTYEIDVKQSDDSFVEKVASNIQIGDVVRALDISTLDYNYNRLETLNWEYSGSSETLISYTSASVISCITKDVEDWFNKITYTDGENVGNSLLPNGKLVLAKTNDIIKFKDVIDLEVGDIIFNSPTKSSTITSVENEYFTGSMTMIDIEPSDVFIAGTNGNEILNTLVVHNRCSAK